MSDNCLNVIGINVLYPLIKHIRFDMMIDDAQIVPLRSITETGTIQIEPIINI